MAEHSPSESRPDDPSEISSPSSTRKRQREPDATLAHSDRDPTPGTDAASAAESRPTKKTKQQGEMEPIICDCNDGADESNKSTADSSDSLQASTTHSNADESIREEERSPLDSLSAEERRKLKGKGRANSDEEDELARLNRELAHQKSLCASQASILSDLRAAVACTVCLETLEKPYALACGHIFCRKCLLEWFFRPDPTAEDDQHAASGSDSTSSSSSPSSSTSSSSSSTSSSESESESDPGSGSNSTESSYVGGSLGGQDFRIRNTGGAAGGPVRNGGSAETFDVLAGRIFETAFGGGGGGGRTGGRGAITAARAEVDGSTSENGRTPGTGAEDLREKERERVETLRQARLARFDSAARTAREGVETSAAAKMDDGTARTVEDEPTDSTTSNPSPPSRIPFAPRTRTNSQSPSAASPSPPPPPPPPAAAAPTPLVLPKGDHRLRNLVCPQCRTPCSERSPHRIFILSEILTVLRRSRATAPTTSATASEEPTTASRTDLPGMDEADLTWGRLFPGVGPGGSGVESKRDRRRRTAQVVRDRDDGVRRCGECNWEIDQRSGLCEGCGRAWNLSSDGEEVSSSSDDERDRGARYRIGHVNRNQRAQARRHHALEDSERSDDDEESVGSGRGSDRGEEDDYESDDFLVRSGEEDEEGQAEREEDDGNSEVERKKERRVARRRRERRQEGEVIDPGSDTESGSDSDSGLEVGSESESESGSFESRGAGEDSPPPVPFRPQPRERPSSSSSSSSSDQEEEVARPVRRKKRVIQDEESD